MKISEPVSMSPLDMKQHQHPVRQRSENRRRHVMLAARVNAEEERQIREAARRQKISVATLLRTAALAAAADAPSAQGQTAP